LALSKILAQELTWQKKIRWQTQNQNLNRAGLRARMGNTKKAEQWRPDKDPLGNREWAPTPKPESEQIHLPALSMRNLEKFRAGEKYSTTDLPKDPSTKQNKKKGRQRG
jgi:hypothetical protein